MEYPTAMNFVIILFLKRKIRITMIAAMIKNIKSISVFQHCQFISMRFQSKTKKSKDKNTHENVKQYPDVDKHRHLAANCQGKYEYCIFNNEESYKMGYDETVSDD